MSAYLLQFGGSALAIATLIGYAHWLGFSSSPKLKGEDEARELLRLIAGGFTPISVAVDTHGLGAIAKDTQGRIALLRPHGGRFVGHALPPETAIEAHDGKLRIDVTPAVELDLGEQASSWAKAPSDTI